MLTRAGLAALISLIAYTPVDDTPKGTVTFTITDRLAGDQLDEKIAVSINNLPVGELKVGNVKREDTLTVTVPAAPSYHYDLCGQLDLAGKDGNPDLHKIDHGGEFGQVDGRKFAAFNTNAVSFYLMDETAGVRIPVQGLTSGHSCQKTVAMD